ncbi:sporulation protein RMD1 [Xylariaceae sp. FL0804]|nr:sporulation protein RMD1 [Xylariaceae sp. FL0804]
MAALAIRGAARRPLTCTYRICPVAARRTFASSPLLRSGEMDAPKQPKRKTVRSSAAKSLRLASATKQAKRSTNTIKPPVLEASDSDELDYRRTIRAICVAQSFDMKKVEEILRLHAFEIDPDETGFDTQAVVHARGANNADVFVFPSGTVVAWGVPEDTLMTLATRQLISAAHFSHIARLELEQLEFTTDETRTRSCMREEVVVLASRDQGTETQTLDTTLAKIAFSSGLARSPKLAVLEATLEGYLQRSEDQVHKLTENWANKLSRTTVLTMTRELLSLRSQLNHYSDVTEELPDMFWDSESVLEEYYNQIGAALAVRRRIEALNKRIDYAHEHVSVLRETLSERHSSRLEWIIIWLIAIEVCFELRRVYREEYLGK